MITACRLAGACAAHAVWCLSDDEPLVPILAHSTEAGERQLERLMPDDDFAKSVPFGRNKLEANEMNANYAVLAYEGVITLDDVPVEGIILELRTYSMPQARAVIIVPYTPKSAGAFRVHKPQLVQWKHCNDSDMQTALNEFFEGVDDHEMGSRVWNDCLDESK